MTDVALWSFAAGSAIGITVTYCFLKRTMPVTQLNVSASKLADIEDVLRPLHDQFHIDTMGLHQATDALMGEFDAGLAGKASSVKMLPSYVKNLPSGKEQGSYLALDLGGTNFRTVEITLAGDGTYDINSTKFAVPENLMTGRGEDLFGFIADRIKEAIGDAPREPPIQLGFCFSFPVDQFSLAAGNLIAWTKGFSASGVEGNDVVKLLQTQVDARKLPVQVSALVNDTVGTLMARALTDTDTVAGLILGTGTNAAYIEEARNVTKLALGDTKQMVINTEWGGFSSKTLRRNEFDEALDAVSLNPGQQFFEKMISGMYLGEIARYVVVKLVNEGKLFSGHLSNTLSAKQPDDQGLTASVMSQIEADTTPNLRIVRAICERELDTCGSTLADRIILKSVCEMVADRAARLSAAGIMAIVQKIPKRSKLTVAVDGSVFKLYHHFQERLNDAVREMGPDGVEILIVGAADGSGVGAAVIAAMA